MHYVSGVSNRGSLWGSASVPLQQCHWSQCYRNFAQDMADELCIYPPVLRLSRLKDGLDLLYLLINSRPPIHLLFIGLSFQLA